MELTPTQAIQMLEHVQVVINRILDQHNIVVILVARRLMSIYADVGENEKAVKQFELVIKKNINVLTNEYATEYSVHSILCVVHDCLLQLGMTEESTSIAKRMHHLYPKISPTDAIQNACPLIPEADEKLTKEPKCGIQ